MPEQFRKEIALILATRLADCEVVDRPDRPESHGWLRRPDHDRVGHEAWELPGGEIRHTRGPGVDRTEVAAGHAG